MLRQGLHYHAYICVRVDVLSKHVPTLVQYLVGQTTLGGRVSFVLPLFFHTGPRVIDIAMQHFLDRI